MANFPDSAYSPRTIENRPGVVYDANNTKTLYAEDLEASNDEIVAIENYLLQKGWDAVGVQPTLQEDQDPCFVLRFASDVSAKLTLGMRVRFTQNGATVYGIIHAIGAFGGGVMDIVVYGGTDYNVSNTGTYPITNFAVSSLKIPVGFNADPRKWTVETSNATNQGQTSPTANVFYSFLNMVVPIGLWRLSWDANCKDQRNSSTDTDLVDFALSTANNSISNEKLHAVLYRTGASGTQLYLDNVYCEDIVSVASAQTYYLVMRAWSAITAIYTMGSYRKTYIRAVSAYL